ncbi:MAG: SDR family NAD(P)-dependent oxidoreductase [Myxococcota bacterium]|nr:SDR family NAD(P)-dependent oxidoreductase [Myxococcota bacterium]
MAHFQNRTILITGAAGGIGAALADALASDGANLVLFDLPESPGEEEDRLALLAADLRSRHDANVQVCRGSVAASEDVTALFASLEDGVDGVINAAGNLRDRSILRMSEEDWSSILATHLTGTFLVSRAAVMAMMRRGLGGRILNMTSVVGVRGNLGQVNYAAAKAGVIGLTRALALEVRASKITVNALAPMADTPMTRQITHMTGSYRAEDLAPLALWLLGSQSSHVTGRVFGAHGAHYFEYVTEATRGVELAPGSWTAKEVGARFDAITARDVTLEQRARFGDATLENVAAQFMENLAATFDAEASRGWRTSLDFQLPGCLRFGMELTAEGAILHDGGVEEPRATISFATPETFYAIVTGSLSPEEALLKQRLFASDPRALQRFFECFDFAAAVVSTAESTTTTLSSHQGE